MRNQDDRDLRLFLENEHDELPMRLRDGYDPRFAIISEDNFDPFMQSESSTQLPFVSFPKRKKPPKNTAFASSKKFKK